MDNTTPVIDTKKNAAKFYKVVETYIKRDGINDLMDWLGSTDFFEAPPVSIRRKRSRLLHCSMMSARQTATRPVPVT